MTGLDTNVLVRYLTEDDPVQSRRAADLITTATTRGERCFVSAIVLCELAWVLRGAYGVSQSDLVLTLDRMLGTTQFVVGDKDVVRRAVDAYRGGRASALWKMVMPGVPEALARLQRQDLTLAVVSNSDGTCAESLEAAGLRRYLGVVIDSADVGVEKPDPRIFEIALARCGAHRHRTLYVGDLYHADVVGGRGAGLHVLLLDPHGDWPELDCERAADLSAVADRFEAGR